MSQQIAVRLTDDELAVLDDTVATGQASSRSDAVRQSIVHLARYRAYRRDAEIFRKVAASGEALYPDFASFPMPDLSDLA